MLDAPPLPATPSTCLTPACLIPVALCNGEGYCRACAVSRWVLVTVPARCVAAVSRYEELAGARDATAADWRTLGSEFDFLARQFSARTPERRINDEHAKFAWDRADRLMAPVAGPVAGFRKGPAARAAVLAASDVGVAS